MTRPTSHAPMVIGLWITMAVPGHGQCVAGLTDTPAFLWSPTDTRLLATATAERPLAAPNEKRQAGPWTPRGQILRVEAAEGTGAAALGRDSLVVLVRWHGPDDFCRFDYAPDSLRVGSRHVLTARLRADSAWLRDLPTFDLYPQHLSDYSLDGQAGPTLPEYRELLSTLPSREEWRDDCRPAVRRMRVWFAEHSSIVRARVNAVLPEMSRACEYSILSRMTRSERWGTTTPVPDQLRAVTERECRADGRPAVVASKAVEGRFIDSAADQWMVYCARPNDWRLMVVVLEREPQVVELARMAGSNRSWLAGVAPPEYVRWPDARDSVAQAATIRPSRDIVLLKLFGSDGDRILAFFESGGQWTQVTVRCCAWPP